MARADASGSLFATVVVQIEVHRQIQRGQPCDQYGGQMQTGIGAVVKADTVDASGAIGSQLANSCCIRFQKTKECVKVVLKKPFPARQRTKQLSTVGLGGEPIASLLANTAGRCGHEAEASRYVGVGDRVPLNPEVRVDVAAFLHHFNLAQCAARTLRDGLGDVNIRDTGLSWGYTAKC